MARSRGYPARSPRKPSWEEGPQERDGAISTATSFLWTTAAQANVPVTIVRIRGYIEFSLLTSDVVNGGFFGAVGIGVFTDEAFTAGAGSIPSPLTDSDWNGWMWHNFWSVRSVTATVGDGVNAFSAYQRIEIDTKAMRKIDSGMIVCGVIDQTETPNATAEVHADTRMLAKIF